jgi:cephalosporin hydroxylase
MQGKTIAYIQNKDIKGLVSHLFRKHIINSLGLALASFLVPPVARLLSPACRETVTNGLFDRPEPSDITDHLPALFCEVLKATPKLVVELGTRGGDSTKAILSAASRSGAKVLSVDVDDCSSVVSASEFREIWSFVQADDVAFAGSFKSWCESNGFPSIIDVLFIDTSHEYEHTVQEIEAWFPLLAENATVIFHDTCMGNYFQRKDGSIAIGWDNQRGVIRAIEEKLDRSFDESVSFVDLCGEWLIDHRPYSNGFTIMSRVSHG